MVHGCAASPLAAELFRENDASKLKRGKRLSPQRNIAEQVLVTAIRLARDQKAKESPTKDPDTT